MAGHCPDFRRHHLRQHLIRSFYLSLAQASYVPALLLIVHRLKPLLQPPLCRGLKFALVFSCHSERSEESAVVAMARDRLHFHRERLLKDLGFLL